MIDRPEGKKVKKARDYGKPIVNVQWLNEILFGRCSCIYQPELQKFQLYNMGNPFKIDYTYVMHLMSKSFIEHFSPVMNYHFQLLQGLCEATKSKSQRSRT